MAIAPGHIYFRNDLPLFCNMKSGKIQAVISHTSSLPPPRLWGPCPLWRSISWTALSYDHVAVVALEPAVGEDVALKGGRAGHTAQG